MKTKELKEMAKKIAKYELIIQNGTNPKEIEFAKEEIMKLSSHVDSLEDISRIDEIVQDLIEKNS